MRITSENLILALITVAAAIFAPLARAERPERPALVIGITVEGLSSAHLRLLSDFFLDGGFNRLANEGVEISDLRFGPGIDATAGAAIVHTGAAPTVNGISAEKVFDKERKAPFNVFFDPSKVGNFTTETYSPSALLTSTLSDEIRIDSRGNGVVESIAPWPAHAIIGAGHAGNGAFWINDANGNWASTTYYFDMPVPVSDRNYKRPLSERLDTIKWEPLFNPVLLPGLSEQKKITPFKHSFFKNDADRYVAFKSSAPGNTEVTDLAIDFINSLNLGRHTGMDMLSITYTVAPYSFRHTSDKTLQTLDCYLRLDRDLARLINAAQKKAAPGKVAVFLAGIPAEANDKRDAERWNIPFGQFSVKKAESLLNMYLMAIHGNGAWVYAYHNRHFYLNTELAKEKQIDITRLRAESAEFLARMSGVAEVYTIDDILAGRAGEDAAALKRNTPVRTSGDVIISVAPGWEIIDDGSLRPSVVHRVAHPRQPAFLWFPGLKPTKIAEPVDARAIAPTVARALWLRAPNGASLPPLTIPGNL